MDVSIHRVRRVVRQPSSGLTTFWTVVQFFGEGDEILGEITIFHDGVEDLDWGTVLALTGDDAA